MIGFGDCNIPYQQFADSGWLERMKVVPIHPGVPTTITSAPNRDIDFGLVSSDIQHIIKHVTPIHAVPWGPHIGLEIVVWANPRAMSFLVQCIPRTFPM